MSELEILVKEVFETVKEYIDRNDYHVHHWNGWYWKEVDIIHLDTENPLCYDIYYEDEDYLNYTFINTTDVINFIDNLVFYKIKNPATIKNIRNELILK